MPPSNYGKSPARSRKNDMRILITGSAGHLGEGLMRVLASRGDNAVGMDILESAFTHHVASITDQVAVERAMEGVDAVVHTATLHKPHMATHTQRDFVDTNVLGTLNLLEAAAAAGVSRFVFTSTTSAFGAALRPPSGRPAAWITEGVRPVPKNIYGVSKTAAEDLCELFHRDHGLPCLVLRTSRFFPDEDDDAGIRQGFENTNVKVNEYLYRRVDLQDAVDAHLLAIGKAPEIGFAKYIISATTPFAPGDLLALRTDAARVVARRFPEYHGIYAARGWKMFPRIDRVYVNEKATQDLGWQPRFDFGHALGRLAEGQSPFSELALKVGMKGYHAQEFEDGPYPVRGDNR